MQHPRISTAHGLGAVYDQTCNDLLKRADSLPPDSGALRFAEFRAIGVLHCKNPHCPWPSSAAAAEIRRVLNTGPGPEFTLSKRGKYWNVVCGSCGDVARGPIHPNDAKQIAALGRIIWAPTHSPYAPPPAEEADRTQRPEVADLTSDVPLPERPSSKFHELLDKEGAIPRGELRKFDTKPLMRMLEQRRDLKLDVDAAFKANELTEHEHSYLTVLNHEHALPR